MLILLIVIREETQILINIISGLADTEKLLVPSRCTLIKKRVSKAEKLRLHCCGANKIKLLKLFPFARLTYPLWYLCPGALYKMANLLKH